MLATDLFWRNAIGENVNLRERAIDQPPAHERRHPAAIRVG